MTTPTAERLARALIEHKPDEHTVSTHNRANDPGQRLAAGGDIYDAIADAINTKTPPRRYIALTTCGWCAPIKPDDPHAKTRPSQHPERRRVTLALVHDTKTGKQTSAMNIDQQETTTESNGTGPLADALTDLAKILTILYN